MYLTVEGKLFANEVAKNYRLWPGNFKNNPKNQKKLVGKTIVKKLAYLLNQKVVKKSAIFKNDLQ